jgi:Flp pilus assembly protein TadD
MNQTTHRNDASSTPPLQAGLDASRSGDAATAIRWFRIACERDPAAAVPAFLLAAELAQAGEVTEAENCYARAVLLDPDLHMARFQLGLLQFTSARASAALLTWAPLFERPQDDPLRHVVQGFAALMQDDFESAIAGLSQGRQLVQGNDALKNDLTMVIERIRRVAASAQAAGATRLSTNTGDPAEAAAEADDIGAHFLLSSYCGDGTVH